MASIVAMPMRAFAQSPTVIFSEIAWAGSSISSSDEWIELTNLSAQSIDLSGWTISGAGSSDKTLTLPETAIIAPYSTFLIANYDSSNENSALTREPDHITATLSLSNNGFLATLSDASGTQVDLAGGSGAPFAGRSGSTGDADDGRYRSMVRVDGLASGDQETSWTDAQVTAGFVSNVEDLGTPGQTEPWFTQDPATSPPSDDPSPPEATDETADTSEEPVDENPEEESVETTTEEEETTESTESTTESETTVEETAQPTEVNGDTQAETVDGTPSPEEVDVVTEGPGEATEPMPTAYTPGTMLINEFVVDPDEGEEWIEIVNRSTESIPVGGWTVEDATGRTTLLEDVSIAAGGFFVLEGPRGKLNNDTDTIILRDGAGTAIDSVTYGTDNLEAPEDGDSLARNENGAFTLTITTTPGGPNVISLPTQTEEMNEPAEEVVEIAETSASEAPTEEIAVVEEEAVSSPTNEPQDESLSNNETVEDTTQAQAPWKGATTLQFSHLYPNTVGSDEQEEYIELINTGDETINLIGWSMEDGSTDQFTFTESTEVAPGKTHRANRTQTALALNNTGDTLELITPDGTVIDLVSYGSAPRGGTYDREGELWSWSTTVLSPVTAAPKTTSTPTSNVSTSTTSTPTATTASTTGTASVKTQSTTKSSYVSFYSIENAKAQSDGTQVRLEGAVTVIPGTFGTQTMYLQDQTGGLQVYFYARDFPELTHGQRVFLKGTMSTAYGERRVKISQSTDIAPSTGTLLIETMELNNDDSQVGALVYTQGQIVSRSASKLTLESGQQQTTIYLKSMPQIDVNQFERGHQITVTGILTRYNDELRLRPRFDSDLSADQTTVAIAGLVESSDKELFNEAQAQTGLSIVFATLAALLILALYRKFPRRKEAMGL